MNVNLGKVKNCRKFCSTFSGALERSEKRRDFIWANGLKSPVRGIFHALCKYDFKGSSAAIVKARSAEKENEGGG